MKTLQISTTLALSLITQTHAVLGPEFLPSERPHSVCAIEFYQSGTLDEVCSVNLDLMRFEESERDNDNSLIKIESELEVPTLADVSTKRELTELLS